VFPLKDKKQEIVFFSEELLNKNRLTREHIGVYPRNGRFKSFYPIGSLMNISDMNILATLV
jgi:hypothetical protein